MARRANDVNRTKPWKAEIRINGLPHFIAHFATEDEARTEEASWRAIYPDARKSR
jgi:hypothetical protein